MKPADQILQRLLNAAAQAPPPAPGPAPFGLETRLLAQWRAADEADETDLVFAFFRRAVVCELRRMAVLSTPRTEFQ